MTTDVERDARGQRLRAFLDTMLATTRAAAGAGHRTDLLQAACDALVGRGAFAMAWIGADQDDDGWIERLAVAGDETGYTDHARISTRDEPEGRGPTGTAARTGQPWVCTDVRADDRMGPWRDRMLAHGFRSSAAFPLRSQALPTGVLNVYAPVEGAFGPDEAVVLDDLASTIGLAIDGLAARQALAESEQRYRRIIDDSVDGILVSDPDGQYVEANPAICAMLGYSREELLRRRVASLHAPSDPVPAAEMERLHEHNPAGFLLERHYLRKDGTVLQTETSYVRLPDGRVQRTVRDISARKLAEEAVRESERQLRLVLDNTTDIISVIDNDGVFTWTSPSIERVLGWQPEDLVGHRLVNSSTRTTRSTSRPPSAGSRAGRPSVGHCGSAPRRATGAGWRSRGHPSSTRAAR